MFDNLDKMSNLNGWGHEQKKMKIGIVGYGPAGITCGMAFHRRGH